MTTNDIQGLTIREATRTDIPLILSFIKDLAAYEKLSHEVAATERLLEKTLFGERRVAEVLIADSLSEPAGFALFFHNFSTFLGRPGLFVEDLYVHRHLRGMGVGKALLAHIAHLAVERGCGRVEWWVLDWNKPAIEFYDSLDALSMNEWTLYRLSGAALQDLAARGRC